MDPEKEFLENAYTMTNFARQEIQQFITWTNKQASYGQAANALLVKLENLSLEIKALKKEYEIR